jgi:hypothetical protein
MGFKYLVEKHAREGMMVYMLWDGIQKSNHLLPNELFKKRKMRAYYFEMLVKNEGVIIDSC